MGHAWGTPLEKRKYARRCSAEGCEANNFQFHKWTALCGRTTGHGLLQEPVKKSRFKVIGIKVNKDGSLNKNGKYSSVQKIMDQFPDEFYVQPCTTLAVVDRPAATPAADTPAPAGAPESNSESDSESDSVEELSSLDCDALDTELESNRRLSQAKVGRQNPIRACARETRTSKRQK